MEATDIVAEDTGGCASLMVHSVSRYDDVQLYLAPRAG